MGQIINKTLDLADLKKNNYVSIAKEIDELISILTTTGSKFTTYQAEFDTGWGEDDIWFRRKLWEMCTITIYSGVRKEHRVLDCGGASTIFSFYLALKGCGVDTVDIDWRKYGIITNANEVAKLMNWNMDNQKASMTELPHEDQTFDRVCSICVLEHLSFKDQIKSIREMTRVLKPNGVIGLTFDYGPAAFVIKYSNVQDINRRIIIPSGLEIMGNRDYQENAWFEEQPGKTWGSLFLKKNEFSNAEKELLICTVPQCRRKVMKVKVVLFLRVLKRKIKAGLWKMGIRKSSKL